MCKLTKKKDITILTLLAWLVYFSSYITRINFSAILVEFIVAEGVQKSAAAIITTSLFVTYGTGQLLSGYLGDRISPVKLIFFGLLIASCANIVLPIVSPNVTVMAIVWGINGLAQAFMWPPLVKILNGALDYKNYAKIIPGIGTSSACATIAVYLFAPLIIGIANWKVVFIISATVAIAAAVIWLVGSKKILKNIEFTQKIEKKQKPTECNFNKENNKVFMKLLPIILIIIFSQGILRDGISTWVPTFISETFAVTSTVSILTGVALPVMHMLISLFTYQLLLLMKRDVFACMALFFIVATIMLGCLFLFGTGSMIIATIIIALVNGTVHGINTLQTCYLPVFFSNGGNISFLSGLLNSATYVGSALSTYLFAIISENRGWNATIVSWIVFSLLGLILTILSIIILRNKKIKTTI